ncbi:MAG: pilus assembly protein [Pseudomonadota bacterium]|jgi:type IV pilus assembly protein PilX
MNKLSNLHNRQHGQRGVVLVVAMVMLLLITILGISSIKSLTLEQRMTSNSIDRNAVFQVTEWALSVAEQAAETQAKLCNSGFVNQGAPVATGDTTCSQTACQNGYCGYPQPNCPVRWEDSAFNGWADLKDPEDPTKNLTTPLGVTPKFFIEYLYTIKPTCIGKSSDGPFSYRVTVQTVPGDGRATVTLQSIYSD